MGIMVRCEGEKLDRALRRLKKICEKEGVIKDIKKNMYYEKPSEKKRRKHCAAVKRSKKEAEIGSTKIDDPTFMKLLREMR